MSEREAQLLETARLAELGLLSVSVAHELRQPIFAARALLQLLVVDLEDAQAERAQEALAQLDLVQDIVGRVTESGRRAGGALVPLDPSGPVAAAVSLLQHRASEKGRTLAWRQEGPPEPVYGDVSALQQIAINLIGNALDAARGEVSVVLRGASLMVMDDGPGIAADIEARLFEPFVTSKPPGEGTGLGLTLTQQLVHDLSASLSWESSEAGTTFTVALHPLSAGRPEDPTP